MSRFFPHTPYAEDQPNAKSILTLHVLRRAFQTGATIGLSLSSANALLRRRKWITTLPSTGAAALLVTLIAIPALPVYMSGKSEVEWKDRSWRLLEHPGQLEVDDWSSLGLGAGGLTGAVAVSRRRVGVVGSRAVLFVFGVAAVGDLMGVGGYMAYRYGLHGGKWPERK